MSNPWNSAEVEPQSPPEFYWADLLLPLVLGAVMPTLLWLAGSCLGIGFLFWPINVLLTVGAGVLGGATIHRRRGGGLSGGDLTRIGLSFAAVQNLPLVLLLGLPPFLLFSDEPNAAAVAGIVLAAVLAILALSVAYVALMAIGGALGGVTMARNGSFGPSWRHADLATAPAGDGASAWVVVGAVFATALVIGLPLMALIVIGMLTVLGNNISEKFKVIAQSVEMAKDPP